MKKILLFSLLAWGAPALSELVDRTVAVVGKEIILQSDVDDLSKRNSSVPLSSSDALKELIDKKLLELECKKFGFYPTAAEVKQTINDVKKQNRLDDRGLTMALQNMGMSFSAYETQLYFELCKSRLIQNKIRGRVNITKEDVRRASEQKYGSSPDIKLKLRELIVRPVSTKASDVDAAKQLALSIFQSLREGQDWDLVLKQAKKRNQLVRSENLGVLSKSDLIAPIADIVFLKSSETFRGPVETEEGFHVFEVLEKVQGQKIPLVDDEKDLHKQLFEKEVERLLKQYLEEVRASTYVDIQDLL